MKNGDDRSTHTGEGVPISSVFADYDRELKETFIYANTLKNGDYEQKLEMKELEKQEEEQKRQEKLELERELKQQHEQQQRRGQSQGISMGG